VGITRECGGSSAPVQQEEVGAAEVKFWKSVTGCTLGDRKDKEIRKELNMYSLDEIVLIIDTGHNTTHAHTHDTHTYTHAHDTHTYTHTHIHTHTHTRTHAHTHARTFPS
jgi:hypothetical protein